MMRILKKLQAWLPAWSGIWTGFIGLIIAAISVFSVPLFFIINIFGLASQYMEIVFILLSILFFIVGVILCIIAYFQMKKAYPVEVSILPINLKETAIRLKFIIIAVGVGLAFIFIIMSSSSVLEYTESNNFCTNACHSTMQPMAVTHQSSSHARVACVDCHINTGTSSFFRSKVSGLRRSFAATFNTHQKPIHLVRHLYPSRASCEHCHWTSKLSGDKLFTKITYDDSREDNQPIYTAMLLRVGGKSGIDQTIRGIHWHTSENLKIRYKTTKDDSEVVWIEELNVKTGKTDTFVTEEYLKTYVNEDLVVKEMSCVDCHNRVAHIARSPDKALDDAITRGQIDRTLPWIKKQGLDFLSSEHSVTSGLQKEAEFFLMDFYKKQYPHKVHELTSTIFQAAKTISEIYSSNVFPEMKVTWDTHASNVGHMATAGCFRCHNDMLVGTGQSAKKSIRSDCTLCHVFIAQDETNPEKIIKYIESGINP